MRAFIRGYGVGWMVLHIAWAIGLSFWFYKMYEMHMGMG